MMGRNGAVYIGFVSCRQQCLAVLNFIQNNFVRLYCDSCQCALKKKIEIGEFLCGHFNIEDGEDTHFQCIMLSYFKDKNATETQ